MKTLAYLIKVYSKHLGVKVYSLILFSIAIAVIDGFGITLMLPLLEGVDSNLTNSKVPRFVIRLMEVLGIPFELNAILIFMLVVFSTKALLKMISGYFQSKMYKELYAKLKLGLFEGIMEVQYRYFSSKNSGHFITVLNDHVNRMIASFNIFIAVVTTSFMASYYIILAASLSWRISLFAAIFGGVAVLLLSRITKYVKRLSKKIAQHEKVNAQNAIQSINAYKYLIATGTFKVLFGKYKSSVDHITQLHFKTQAANVFSRSTRELVTVSLLIVLIYIETQVFNNPIASILLILILFYRAVNQLMFIQNNFQLLLTSMGMIESVDEEFSELKNNKHPQNTIQISATDFQSNIELRNIEFAFSGSSSFKLNINDLQIEPNKVLAFVGPSGGGKSTLVDLILGVHTSQKGQILFNQKPINQVDLNSLRKYIGYVSQDVTLFDDSIVNNITLFQLNPDLEKVKQACVQANVWSFIESLELGLETQIGEKGIRISGGQRQRLSIARELFKCPKLLILDEATSALDVESELVVQEAIENLRGSITVIVIAHRLVTIKSAEIIAVLEEGMLIEKGTYSDLSENVNSRFYTMLNAQKI